MPLTFPDKQPPGGWVVKLYETNGTVRANDFAEFVKLVNAQLASNGFQRLSWEAILERTRKE